MLTVIEEVSGGDGDRGLNGFGVSELALGVLIPEEVGSVLAVGGEGVELPVEADAVDCVHLRWLLICSIVILGLLVNSMALEAEVISIKR